MKVEDDEFDLFSGDADTLAGLILEMKGDFPSLHERLELKNYTFEIMELDGRRISKVKIVAAWSKIVTRCKILN